MIKDGKILAGFAGAVADASVFEKLEEARALSGGDQGHRRAREALVYGIRYLRRLNALPAGGRFHHLFAVSAR